MDELGVVQERRGANQVDVGPIGGPDRILQTLFVSCKKRHGGVFVLDLGVREDPEQRRSRTLGIQV